MVLHEEKKAGDFEFLVNKYAQVAGLKDLVPKGPGPSVNVEQLFAPVAGLFSSDKQNAVSPEAAANAMKNLGSQIDASFGDADANTLATLKSHVSQLSSLPHFSQELLSSLVNSSNVLKKVMPAPQAAAPAPSAATPKIDIKSQQKELQTASAVVKGIAQMMARPGANRKVLLARLNKYRLAPMAKLFTQLVAAGPNLDAASKSFLANLDGLFKQVKQTFASEDIDMLASDPSVKAALDAEGSVGTSDAPITASVKHITNVISKFAKYDF